MSEHNITVNGGSSVRLPTAGKYCDRDIVVNALGGGVNLPELTNPGAAGDLMAGKELIDETGAKVTGSFTLDPEMTEQDSLIRRIKTALQGKAAGGADPVCGCGDRPLRCGKGSCAPTGGGDCPVRSAASGRYGVKGLDDSVFWEIGAIY